MKASTWKAVFAAMNPSPVFEAVAQFAELKSRQQRMAILNPLDDNSDLPDVSKELRKRSQHSAQQQLMILRLERDITPHFR
jgi:hypothetical protein